ncbi:hypothetical protein BDP27DRAFT_1407683 [Rhodocollybia butyracea]|uniref:Lipoprotein n=1 Tax=Rhodocollybia butyracea TaxID=206335 RepID=A0A9P5P9L1_9AGAR|nr:hypothetical protein BDP27DRAFT_1407683 [Rhodocollybia butyracea]
MRFITFAATALLGCFLSTGICVQAKPISVSSSAARAPDELPAHQRSWVYHEGGTRITDSAAVEKIKKEVIEFVLRFNKKRILSPPETPAEPPTFFDGGAPTVLTNKQVWFRFTPNGPKGEPFEGHMIYYEFKGEILDSKMHSMHKEGNFRSEPPPGGHKHP